jgi:putative holliday junction resolvase
VSEPGNLHVFVSSKVAVVELTAPHYKGRMVEDKPQPTADAADKPETSPEPAGVLGLEAFAAALPEGGRLIGIDVGTKTLGLALSDVSRMIASALETIRRTKFREDAARLMELAAAHGVRGYVVGLPLNLDGTQGPRAQASRAFARNIAVLTRAPILLWDERLSTAEVERMLIQADTSRRRRAEVIDKLAATLILQGALDRMRLLSCKP